MPVQRDANRAESERRDYDSHQKSYVVRNRFQRINYYKARCKPSDQSAAVQGVPHHFFWPSHTETKVFAEYTAII